MAGYVPLVILDGSTTAGVARNQNLWSSDGTLGGLLSAGPIGANTSANCPTMGLASDIVLPLPTGAATAAGLTTINGTLGTPMQQSGGSLVNISGTISLPTLAATSTLQSSTLAAVKSLSQAATATHTTTTSAVGPFTILAANANRLGGSTIANNSTGVLLVSFGATVASATSWDVYLAGSVGSTPAQYPIPDNWTGAITGYYAVANGNVMVSEKSA